MSTDQIEDMIVNLFLVESLSASSSGGSLGSDDMDDDADLTFAGSDGSDGDS